MKNGNARVVGSIKVAIPTLLHPNVPYYILLLRDEAGNTWGHKSEIEYQTGDELKFEPNAGAVAIWRVKYDIREGIEKVLELAEASMSAKVQKSGSAHIGQAEPRLFSRQHIPGIFERGFANAYRSRS
jgi:hypothetical protein